MLNCFKKCANCNELSEFEFIICHNHFNSNTYLFFDYEEDKNNLKLERFKIGNKLYKVYVNPSVAQVSLFKNLDEIVLNNFVMDFKNDLIEELRDKIKIMMVFS